MYNGFSKYQKLWVKVFKKKVLSIYRSFGRFWSLGVLFREIDKTSSIDCKPVFLSIKKLSVKAFKKNMFSISRSFWRFWSLGVLFNFSLCKHLISRAFCEFGPLKSRVLLRKKSSLVKDFFFLLFTKYRTKIIWNFYINNSFFRVFFHSKNHILPHIDWHAATVIWDIRFLAMSFWWILSVSDYMECKFWGA